MTAAPGPHDRELAVRLMAGVVARLAQGDRTGSPPFTVLDGDEYLLRLWEYPSGSDRWYLQFVHHPEPALPIVSPCPLHAGLGLESLTQAVAALRALRVTMIAR